MGIDALAADVKATRWEDIERRSGLTRAAIEATARVYMKAERTIVVYGMGLTPHRHGAGTVQQLANVCLLQGQHRQGRRRPLSGSAAIPTSRATALSA